MRHREFNSDCKFRYDEIRPDRGSYSKDKTKAGGERALKDRCVLRNYGNRKCLYPNYIHKKCPIGKGRRK